MENQVRFHGRGGEFFGIWIVNCLLSILTLGIYSAWAKVRTKKYFYGNTDLAGDRFDYHATPIQILIGRVIAIICVSVWFVVSEINPIISAILLIVFSLLMPWLVRNNTRFDARVTSFRNVRFDFKGSLKGAYGVFLGLPLIVYALMLLCFAAVVALASIGTDMAVIAVLSVITFFIGFALYAWVMAKTAGYFINGYRYGDRIFSGTVDFKVYIKTYLLGGLLTFGLLTLMSIIFVLTSSISLDRLLNLSQELTQPELLIESGIYLFLGYIGMLVITFVVSAFIKVRIRNYLYAQITINGEPEYRLDSKMTTLGLLSLMLTNFLLTIVTFGFGRPWVMVRRAKYVSDMTMVHGDLSKLDVEGEKVSANSAVADEVANGFDLSMGIG